jgi:hypothetical protein
MLALVPALKGKTAFPAAEHKQLWLESNVGLPKRPGRPSREDRPVNAPSTVNVALVHPKNWFHSAAKMPTAHSNPTSTAIVPNT